MGKYRSSNSCRDHNYKTKQIHRPRHEDNAHSSHYYQKSHKKKKYRYNYSPSQKKRYRNQPSYYSSSPSYSSSSSSSPSHSQSSIQSLSSAAQRHRVQHYKFQKGQKLDQRYKTKKLLGDGTFGRVVECRYKHRTYAVKVIKPVQKYINSARIERSIIKRINDRDQYDAYGIVRYVESFYHKKHFCMVFKPLGKSLYDFLKKNNFKGFPLPLVQSFFKQILRSIGFLHRNGYTHTDLKPENILLESNQCMEVNERVSYCYQARKYHYNTAMDEQKRYYLPLSDKIRIIDFGGATKYDDYHSTIINTRQYRSPEVILQCCRWNQISDVWSIGCIICELFTGQLFFAAYDDQQHLAMIEKNSGKFPNWMISKMPTDHHERKMFRDGFINQSKLSHIETIVGMKVVQDIFQGQHQLIDLLRLCLEIDPNKRINCSQALRHPFFSRKYS